MKSSENYPAWICSPCGERHGRRTPTCATFHNGDRCGWCGELTVTTEPRDFGYPAPPPVTMSGRAALEQGGQS